MKSKECVEERNCYFCKEDVRTGSGVYACNAKNNRSQGVVNREMSSRSIQPFMLRSTH